MPQIVGLSLLSLWSLGFLTPFTIIGFMEVLLIIAVAKFLLKKLKSLETLKFITGKRFQGQTLNNNN